MKIFITGATGFIGSRLALKLAEAGHTVHLLCRSSPPEILAAHLNTRIYRGDITREADIESAMEGCARAFHLAAYARLWANDPGTYYRVNVLGTRNVVTAARNLGIRKLVFTSTAGVFGPAGPDASPGDEYARFSKPFDNAYTSSKLDAEKAVLDAAAEGLHSVIVNPTRVYGPGPATKSNAVTRIIKYYLEGRWRFVPGDGTVVANYTYIEDVVNGHLGAMNRGRSGERYILGGINVSYNELFEIINQQADVNRTRIPIPMPAIRAAAWLDLLSAKLFEREPTLTPTWVDGMRVDAYRSSHKAKRELGYEVTPLEEGIRETINWLKEGEVHHEYHIY